jgi:hypothetical protein
MAEREVLLFLLVQLLVSSGHAGEYTAKIKAISTTFITQIIPSRLIAF